MTLSDQATEAARYLLIGVNRFWICNEANKYPSKRECGWWYVSPESQFKTNKVFHTNQELVDLAKLHGWKIEA